MAKIPVDFYNFIDRVAGDSKLNSTGVFADRIDLIRSRTSILSGKDKTLMQIYLDRGISFQQMATVTGISRARIARKINRLIKVLLGSEYIECLRNQHLFTQEELGIALEYFIEGQSQVKIAEKRDITQYQVKKSLDRIYEITSKVKELRHAGV